MKPALDTSRFLQTCEQLVEELWDSAREREEMLETLRDGEKFASAVCDTWEKGDLAGAVADIDAWRDYAKVVISRFGGAA